MPAFVAVAVKVMFVPWHIGRLAAVVSISDGVVVGLTVRVKLFDAAVVEVTQLSLEVITQLTTSELTKAVVIKVLLFVPAFTPFIFHW